MPGHIPSLDHETLLRLRSYVHTLKVRTNGTLPIEQIVGLARDVRAPVGVTLDLQASEQLGAPLVVIRVSDSDQSDDILNGLTDRERQVCALITAGKPNKQIATRLSISLATVKDHVHNILRKTGLPNRAAIAAAYRHPLP